MLPTKKPDMEISIQKLSTMINGLNLINLDISFYLLFHKLSSRIYNVHLEKSV